MQVGMQAMISLVFKFLIGPFVNGCMEQLFNNQGLSGFH